MINGIPGFEAEAVFTISKLAYVGTTRAVRGASVVPQSCNLGKKLGCAAAVLSCGALCSSGITVGCLECFAGVGAVGCHECL
jgi:hypothetical protein